MSSPPAAQRPQRAAPLLLTLIMVGGLLLRLIFYTAFAPFNGFPPILDEGNYIDLAVPLSQGMGFVEKWVWLRPPGYPAFLALFLLLGGGNFAPALLVQVLLSTANIGVVYAMAREAFAGRADMPTGKAQAVGLVAAGLMALNPHVVFYANLFMVETLYILLFSVLVWLLLRARRLWPESAPDRGIYLMLAVAGVIAAAGVFVRSLLLSFTPIFMAWLWWVLPRPAGSRRGFPLDIRWNLRALLPVALFFAVMLASILPWSVLNYLKYDRFLLVDTMAGYNLWQYNDLISKEEIVSRLAQIENPVDRERFASEQGLRAILSHPDVFAADAMRRLGDAWPVEYFAEFKVSLRDKLPGSDCTNLDLYAWAGTLFYVGFGLLTLWGVVFAPGRMLKGLFLLLVLHYVVTSVITHMEFRYRIPLYPLASIFAAWPVVSIAGALRNRRDSSVARDRGGQRRSVLIAATAALSLLFLWQCSLFAFPGLPDSLRFERRYQAGKSLMASGEYERALAEFEGAEQVDRGCACLYRYIGQAQGRLGRPDQERAAYLTALSREPHDWRTRALLSDRLRAAGDARFAAPLNATRPQFRMAQLQWAWDNLSVPARSLIDLGADDLGSITGFESAETEPQPAGEPVTYRWTTQQSSIRLLAPEGEGRLLLKVRWHSLAWPGKPDPDSQVQIIVAGRNVGKLVARPGWEEASIELPDGLSVDGMVVQLQTITQKPPGPEPRSLGVAVDFVTLERTE